MARISRSGELIVKYAYQAQNSAELPFSQDKQYDTFPMKKKWDLLHTPMWVFTFSIILTSLMPYCNIKVQYIFADIECGIAAPIRHGSYEFVNDTRHYLSMVRYICDPGYVMVGRYELICEIDGRWDGPPPKCIRKFFFSFSFF